VAAFAHGEWLATVVFDGHSNPASEGLAHRIAGVTVVFSKFGVDADAVIEALAREARTRGDESVVVTSDAQTQWAVVGGSVSRMSSAEFSGELREGGREWTNHAPSGSSSGRLEDRIDGETRERLWRWARGRE
jgi:predicted RNA-binding protein with PIN domain